MKEQCVVYLISFQNNHQKEMSEVYIGAIFLDTTLSTKDNIPILFPFFFHARRSVNVIWKWYFHGDDNFMRICQIGERYAEGGFGAINIRVVH